MLGLPLRDWAELGSVETSGLIKGGELRAEGVANPRVEGALKLGVEGSEGSNGS